MNKLEEICAAKFVTIFCCQPQVKEKLSNIILLRGNRSPVFSDEVFKLKSNLEQKFIDEIKKFPIPIRRIMPIHLINYIVDEMIECQKYHLQRFGLKASYSLNFLQFSHFNHNGTLDKVQIARDMMKDESLHHLMPICIAIGSFLLDDIRVLFKKLTGNERKYIYHGKFIKKFKFSESRWPKDISKIILYLAIKNEKYDAYLSYMCEFGFVSSEIVFKNSWKKLSLSYKEKLSHQFLGLLYHSSCYSHFVLDNAFLVNKSTMDILRFLICNLDEKVLKSILIHQDLVTSHLFVLKQLLFWPYQDIFIKTLDLVWDKLPYIHFYELLHSVFDLIEDYKLSDTYNYRFILKKIWSDAPPDYKKYFSSMESERNRPSYSTHQFYTFTNKNIKFVHYYQYNRGSTLDFLLSRLFGLKVFTNDDVRFVEQISSDITASDNQKIVSEQGDNICEKAIILSGKLGLADLFIKCFVEKELINEYKKGFYSRRGNYISEILLSLGEESFLDDITNWACDF